MSERKRPRFHAKTHARNPEFAVQQNFVTEADINTKIDRHMRGPGRIGQRIGDPNATRQGRFMELSSDSFHDMLNKVTDAQSAFRGLPARVKTRFSNDPYQLLRFMENPANRAEAERLGLVDPQYVSPEETAPEGPLEPENQDPEDDQGPDPEAQPKFTKKGAKKSER